MIKQLTWRWTDVDWTILTYVDKIYNGIMDEVKLMGYYDNDNDNKLCVDNNDACYKYIRYLYDDGGWTKISVNKQRCV